MVFQHGKGFANDALASKRCTVGGLTEDESVMAFEQYIMCAGNLEGRGHISAGGRLFMPREGTEALFFKSTKEHAINYQDFNNR